MKMILFCCVPGFVIGCALLRAPYAGHLSDHCDGKRFYNQERGSGPTFLDFLKWVTVRKQGAWKRREAEPIPAEKPPARVANNGLRITFVNHATFLVQTAGVNMLTDPIWSERASPVPFAGPRRMRPPGIAFEDLPRIDLVLVSHNHYDHLDLPTLRRIARAHDPVVVTTLGNKELIGRQGFSRVVELDWWQQTPVSRDVRVVCVPSRHFSGRGLFDAYRTPWAGFVLETGQGAVYFAGDTGFGPHFREIAGRFDNIRLALLPIGAFMPEWFMSFAHMSPADALRAHIILRARTSVATHFGTFPLADDGQDDPVNALRDILAITDLRGTEFWALDNGEGRDVPMLR